MNDVQQFLARAKTLVDTPEKWIKKHYAETAEGFAVSSVDKSAVCFCVSGAIQRFPGWLGLAENALIATIPSGFEVPIGFDPIAYYNDDEATTHKDVMTWIDRAIAYAGEDHGVDA